MRTTSRGVLALVAAGALVLSACGGDEGEGLKACQITDTGGIDDKSFNETAYKGLLDAQEEFGVEPLYLESTSEADYEPNILAFIDQDCDIIITVGFALGETPTADTGNFIIKTY